MLLISSVLLRIREGGDPNQLPCPMPANGAVWPFRFDKLDLEHSRRSQVHTSDAPTREAFVGNRCLGQHLRLVGAETRHRMKG